ncbi:hypothetical protein [Arthrobacter cryoconiti]|uniref:Transposase n=1 Tax=Arthrobacter cryoconiti TaxID=748907 RepID=A0ABV8R012_9MICC|nr:hypothetical protein [Arthrobacter cryoconiti]MCC9069862.1 hypothetical protein [Arthrobacter cryoconiti]
MTQHGDRQRNRTLDTIAKARMRLDPASKAYVHRRTEKGNTMREFRRCLEGAIARQLYRKFNAITL